MPRALDLLRDTIEVLMETTPKGLDLEQVLRRKPCRTWSVTICTPRASTRHPGALGPTSHVDDGCLNASTPGSPRIPQACAARGST
ncbi:hypothetical protein QJS66_19385 [Kocuria rhizophila]|nr:hypothetical protein QJS66_19385 [Kocuria rhizophila]